MNQFIILPQLQLFGAVVGVSMTIGGFISVFVHVFDKKRIRANESDLLLPVGLPLIVMGALCCIFALFPHLIVDFIISPIVNLLERFA